MDEMQRQAAQQAPKATQVVVETNRSGNLILTPLKWLLREMIMPALEKAIPQGAAELSQALFTENGYVPYGPTEQPMGEAEPQVWRTNDDLATPEITGREITR